MLSYVTLERVSEERKGGGRTDRRKTPLMSWAVEPVMPNLSRYQWMLRKLSGIVNR